jgi:hypothetical protein
MLHSDFVGSVAIREDGLLIHKRSGVPLGVSYFTKAAYIHPPFYKPMGLLRPGSKDELLQLVRSQPGLVASWQALPNRELIIRDFEPVGDISEQDLYTAVVSLLTELSAAIAPGMSRCKFGKTQLPLGAYGVLATAKRRDKLGFLKRGERRGEAGGKEVVYRPIDTAVIGNCDLAFVFGEGSGAKKDKDIVAVVELKVFGGRHPEDFHDNDKSLCAQIFTSLIGSEAPLGIIVTNRKCKFIWKKHVGEHLHFQTFPDGRLMADLEDPQIKELLVEVFHELVRCSVRSSERGKTDTVDPSTTEWRYILQSIRRDESSCGGDTPITALTADDSIVEFTAYSFAHLSAQQFVDLQEALVAEERRLADEEY